MGWGEREREIFTGKIQRIHLQMKFLVKVEIQMDKRFTNKFFCFSA